MRSYTEAGIAIPNRETLGHSTVVGIFRASIKGTQMESLDRANLTPRGIEHDRMFMFVAAEPWRNKAPGDFMNGKVLPNISRIRSNIEEDVLFVTAPGIDIENPIKKDGEIVVARMYPGQDSIETIDQGDEAALVFSKFFGVPVRLVRIREDHNRLAQAHRSAGHAHDQIALQDGGQLSVGSMESRMDLNDRIITGGRQPVGYDNFRANILIFGSGIPYIEDRIRRMRIGNVEIVLTGESSRCIVTTRNQTTAKAHPQGEPLRTLSTYRKKGDNVYFDQNAIQDLGGREFQVDSIVGQIEVGQILEILETKTPLFA